MGFISIRRFIKACAHKLLLEESSEATHTWNITSIRLNSLVSMQNCLRCMSFDREDVSWTTIRQKKIVSWDR